MDIYDPQTLGIVVFGGFTVFSAIVIVMVSTFSMKETLFEDTMGKQRKTPGKTQSNQRTDKKKKDKATEKKTRGKKREADVTDMPPEHGPPTPPASEHVAAVVPKPDTPSQKMVEPAPSQKSSPTASQKPSPAEPAQKSASPAQAQKLSPPSLTEKSSPPAQAQKSSSVALVDASSPKNKKKKVVPPVGPLKAEEPKQEPPPKKKGDTKKTEPGTPLCLPYKTLVSTVSSMTFSEGEAQQLMEILSDKGGLTWHRATQKGGLVVLLQKHLEEREKQLTAEQEDAAAAKSRLRELSKELSVEKSKMASVETRLSSRLREREQDLKALHARLQTSYQDHLTETQQLNAKVLALQEQLEKGPSAQLTRLEQENSVLRDALSQATSQMEENAELAKLRQDCVHLNKELMEKTGALQAEEQHRKTLESKAATAEEQLAHLQTLTAELEQTRNSLREKERRVSSLEEELAQHNNTSTNQVSSSQESLVDVLKSFQEETKEVLHSLFPQIQIEAEQSGWLQDFTSKAQETLKHNKESQQSTELLEVMETLQAAQQRQCSLQAECERYRTVLTQTEEMLNTLQRSVEQEEKVWRSRIMKSEEQLREALQKVQELENAAEGLRTENQGCLQLKRRLSESERRLSAAQQQIHTQREELSQVQAELVQTLEKLQREQILSQQLSAEAEQAQENFRRQLETVELMRSAEDTASIEDIIMECLDKERKMTKDLGQAATKLQQLLRNSQDRLAKERERVRALEEQLQEQGPVGSCCD